MLADDQLTDDRIYSEAYSHINFQSESRETQSNVAPRRRSQTRSAFRGNRRPSADGPEPSAAENEGVDVTREITSDDNINKPSDSIQQRKVNIAMSM